MRVALGLHEHRERRLLHVLCGCAFGFPPVLHFPARKNGEVSVELSVDNVDFSKLVMDPDLFVKTQKSPPGRLLRKHAKKVNLEMGERETVPKGDF